MDYGTLGTEQVNDKSRELDRMSALEIVTLMNELDLGALEAVKYALAPIAEAADQAARRISAGGRVFYMGAGTSGRLGVLDASECPPTFGVSDQVFIGIIAGGDGALRKAVEGAEDDQALAARELESRGVNEKDMVVAISASGSAPYCIGALQKARESGALAVSMCCNLGTSLSAAADIAIEMPTGAEVLSGSTRLRAGTATKLALNMISTACMVRLGKVYKNLMVDMNASNAKLKDRAVRITMKALDIDRSEAGKALAEAGGSIKTAIVMRLGGCERQAAREVLERANGFVREALDLLREN